MYIRANNIHCHYNKTKQAATCLEVTSLLQRPPIEGPNREPLVPRVLLLVLSRTRGRGIINTIDSCSRVNCICACAASIKSKTRRSFSVKLSRKLFLSPIESFSFIICIYSFRGSSATIV